MESIPKKPGIYQIRNLVNGKMYIGSAVNLNRRCHDHFSQLRDNKHNNQHLQRAYNKYGEHNFVFEIIELVPDRQMLIKQEQYYIDTLNAVNEGYNICPVAGSTLGRPHTEVTKLKLTGANNPMFGKHHTLEVRKSISQSLKGRIFSEEHKRNLSIAGKGKIISAKARDNMSKAQKGRIITEEHRKKLSENSANARQVICIELNQIFRSCKEAATFIKRHPSCVNDCCRGKQKTAGGYHWRYVD